MRKRRIRQHWIRANMESRRERYAAAARTTKRAGDEEGHQFYLGAVWAINNIEDTLF